MSSKPANWLSLIRATVYGAKKHEIIKVLSFHSLFFFFGKKGFT